MSPPNTKLMKLKVRLFRFDFKAIAANSGACVYARDRESARKYERVGDWRVGQKPRYNAEILILAVDTSPRFQASATCHRNTGWHFNIPLAFVHERERIRADLQILLRLQGNEGWEHHTSWKSPIIELNKVRKGAVKIPRRKSKKKK